MDSKKPLLVISPKYPNAINGLGDYSAILGEKLKKHFQIIYAGFEQSEPVTVTPYISIQGKKALQSTIQSLKVDVVFLNYVNFAFQEKGLPFWLIDECKAIKAKGIKLVIFFHELNASANKPWNLVFWTKPLQQYIYRKLISYADLAFCSNHRIKDILLAHQKDKLFKIGIFSNVSEPLTQIPYCNKSDSMVVFGTLNRRLAVYQHHIQLNNLLIKKNIKKLIDIGPGDAKEGLKNINCEVKVLGKQSSLEIAKEFEKHKIALIDYPISLIEKSGIFAAYAAYGFLVYNFNNHPNYHLTEVEEGIHYLNPSNEYVSDASQDEQISDQLFQWYQNHNQEIHAQFIADKIKLLIQNYS